uniref:Major facilitator superfamily (MFS) profile domain-containing protein n=1 Tax=Tetradesmus obliquus TaxID=3088 RepID=A0A383WCM1_TETOB
MTAPHSSSSSSSAFSSSAAARPLALKVALCAMVAIGFADMYTYSMPVAFLGQVLAAQDASSVKVMIALGLEGIATSIMAVLVLLSQSLPAVSRLSAAAKWWLVIGGQAASVASSLLPALLPKPEVVTACRALHGAATAVYMVYCLILLVELCPPRHLALGIAALSAGCSAGDSLGPVLGAVAFDRGGGLPAAFLLQTAVNAVPLLLALLVVPLWVWLKNDPTAVASSTGSGSGGSGGSMCLSDSSQTNHHQLPRMLRWDSACSSYDRSAACHPHKPADQCCKNKELFADGDSDDVTVCSDCSASQQCLDAGRCHAPNHKAAAAAAAAAAGDADTQPVRDVNASSLRHMDSALDIEAGHFNATPAAKLKQDDSELNPGKATSQEEQQQQQQGLGRQQSSSLDVRAVFATVCDAVVAGQCLLVLLEQAATGAVVVLLPAVAGLPTWLMGVLYIAMVGGAIAGPFALQAYLSCKRIQNKHTYHLAWCIAGIFATSSSLAVLFCGSIPALVCLLFVFGFTQASTEALVYIHIARRLEQLARHVATHVSMCMFTIALALGAGIGNMIGGLVQREEWGVQLGVVCGMAGATAVCGTVVSLVAAKASNRP